MLPAVSSGISDSLATAIEFSLQPLSVPPATAFPMQDTSGTLTFGKGESRVVLAIPLIVGSKGVLIKVKRN